MSKGIDLTRGYKYYPNTPLSEVGVYPYSAKMIGLKDEDPTKLFNVYRPLEELEKAIDSFDTIPVIVGHDMIGDNGKSPEQKPAIGSVSGINLKGNKLFGNIKIWTSKIKDKIQQDVKELSLGYDCKYEPIQGTYNGKRYDFIQRFLIGNHLALVPEGRMGSQMALDHSEMTFDSIELGEGEEMEETQDEFISIEAFKKQYNSPKDLKWAEGNSYKRKKDTKDGVEAVKSDISKTNFVTKKTSDKDKEMEDTENKIPKGTEGKDEDVDKRKLIDEIGGILKGKVDEEIWRTIIGKIEKASYNKSDEGKSDDEEEEVEDENKADDEEVDLEAKDKEEKDGEKEETHAMDASEIRKSVLSTIRGMDNFAKKIFPHTGSFAYDNLESEEQMAYIACNKLKIDPCGNAKAAINGFLSARSDVRYTFDNKENLTLNTKQEAAKRLDSFIK